MKQYFLNQNKPAIDSAIDKLYDLYAQTTSGEWNMSKVLLVVPSARIRREFLYRLILFAQEKNTILEAPKILTIGRAPEFLYRQTRPFADDVTQYLAWYRAITMSDKDKRKEFLPSMPDKNDLEGQYLLGQMFSRLHQSLSAELLNYYDEKPQSEINIVNKLEEFEKNHSGLNLSKEIERWKFFSEIKKNYLSILDEHNLWDVQVARRHALAYPQPGDFVTQYDLVLAGIVDLNRVQKAILQQVGDHVTALIYAPESESNGFDAFGALKVDYWNQDLLCPLDDSQIIQVEKPEEQVLCAFEYIRQLSKDYTPGDITIGAPDEKLIPYVQATADKLGLLIDNAIGQSVSSTAPYALLQSITEFLDSGSYASFANLVRHPSVYAALLQNSSGTKKDILSVLDNFQQEYFPLSVSSGVIKNLAPTQSCSGQEINMVRDALHWVLSWLSDLIKKEVNPAELAQIIAKLFNQLPEEKSDLNRTVEKIIIDSCERLNAISEDFIGKLSPQSALKMILLRLQSFNLPNGSEDISMSDEELDELAQQGSSKPMLHVAGWLELLWDRAPVLTILSFNEGIVPQSVNANLFLPNELRKELGIMDNDRRFARDAYVLKAMASSKKHLLAICGKRDTEDKPRLPSRLLFNKDKYTQQAFNYFNDKLTLSKFTISPKASGSAIPSVSSRNAVLQWAADNLSGIVLKGVVKNVSATKFKEYIQCPFRFYLNYVAKVQPTDYSISEMQPLSFGSFIHQVLQRWAQNELDSGQLNWHPKAEELSEQLNAIVDELFEQSYPNSVQPSIVIQKEIIKQRLAAFAEFQQTWPGNTIAVEQDFEQVVTLKDKEKMTLIGRIDRIDLSPEGDIILLDYKTSDTGDNPREDHLDKDGNWINLQLPIYRRLLLANKNRFSEFITKGTQIKVGYINISKAKDAKNEDPNWLDSDFDAAEDKMMEVMENIHNGVFWPPSEDVKYDSYPEYVRWLLEDDENTPDNKPEK